MYKLQNELLSIGVEPQGAELCSIKNLQTGIEHIWQADPKVWASHAPNLFPVIGVLKNGEYYFNSKKYTLPKHGFIRYNENIRLEEKTDSELTFKLSDSEETFRSYPFRFQLRISFLLNGKTLKVSHSITNEDEKPMYFSLGGHPAFNVPLYEGETYEDYFLQFDQAQDLNTARLNKHGLISNETELIAKNDDKIQLRPNLFDRDALIFRNIPSKKVELKSKKSGTALTVEYQDFEHLGIWAKPGAPFVCIEPWLGMADLESTDQELKTKEGIIELMPSQQFKASYSISIE